MPRRYTRELLAPLVAESYSIAEVVRKLGLRQAGGNHTHISRRIRELGLDSSHFLGSNWNRGDRHVGGPAKLTAAELLVERSELDRRTPPFRLRRALLEIGRRCACELCGLSDTWRGQPLRLEIDHSNGRHNDNRPENLRYLCPNCHSQTETYCARNIGRSVGSGDVAEEVIKPALKLVREVGPKWLTDCVA